jgi:hypothetical protein
MGERSLFSGPWSKRQMITWLILIAGLGGSIAGLVLIHGSISKKSLVLLIGGITLLCGGLVYLLATEDRGTGLVAGDRRGDRA